VHATVDGGGRALRLVRKQLDPATGRPVGMLDEALLAQHRFSVNNTVARSQRLLLRLVAKLEYATTRTLLESRSDRTSCVVAPLPLGAVDSQGQPLHGVAMVIGGAALRRGENWLALMSCVCAVYPYHASSMLAGFFMTVPCGYPNAQELLNPLT
jgi:hypothetical protein